MSATAPFASDADVRSIGERLLALRLPKSEWTHAGHFAAAVYLLVERRDLDLTREMPGIVRAYNRSTGVANTDFSGYHETITQASLRAARAYVERMPETGLAATCNAILASELGRSTWLLRYWRRETLESTEARARWHEPDITALPYA